MSKNGQLTFLRIIELSNGEGEKEKGFLEALSKLNNLITKFSVN